MRIKMMIELQKMNIFLVLMKDSDVGTYIGDVVVHDDDDDDDADDHGGAKSCFYYHQFRRMQSCHCR